MEAGEFKVEVPAEGREFVVAFDGMRDFVGRTNRIRLKSAEFVVVIPTDGRQFGDIARKGSNGCGSGFEGRDDADPCVVAGPGPGSGLGARGSEDFVPGIVGGVNAVGGLGIDDREAGGWGSG